MINELSERIWNRAEFHDDFRLLEDDILYRTLGLVQNGNELKSQECIGRLIQSAACFSACPQWQYRTAALRIATACWSLFGEEYNNLANITDFILRRLGNFPASQLLHGLGTPRDILSEPGYPPVLWLEVNAKEIANTVAVSGSETATFTNFQRDLWDYLKDGNSVTISAPTSAGKSYALQYFMASECASNTNYYAFI